MRNHYEDYKCIKHAEKEKKKKPHKTPTQPSKQKVNALNPCILLEAGFHAIHGHPKGPSMVLPAGSICPFPWSLTSLYHCLPCVYKAVCAQNPGAACAPTETLQ